MKYYCLVFKQSLLFAVLQKKAYVSANAVISVWLRLASLDTRVLVQTIGKALRTCLTRTKVPALSKVSV